MPLFLASGTRCWTALVFSGHLSVLLLLPQASSRAAGTRLSMAGRSRRGQAVRLSDHHSSTGPSEAFLALMEEEEEEHALGKVLCHV